MPTSSSRLTALAALAPITWGTTYVVTTELLPPDRPMTAAVLRALPAGLLLLLITREALPREWWGRVAVLGVLNIGAFFPLLFLAAYRLPGSVAAVVGALGPFIAAGMSVALGAGRPTRAQLAWALVAVGGVALTTVGAAYRLDVVGIAAAVGGAVVMSAGVVLTRHWGQPSQVSGLALTGWQLAVGGLVVVPLVGIVDTGPMYVDGRGLAGYAWLALVGTALAYSLWFRAARVLPPFGMSMLTRLSPVTAAVVGWALLGEALTGWQVAGFALALLASLRAQGGGRTRPVPQSVDISVQKSRPAAGRLRTPDIPTDERNRHEAHRRRCRSGFRGHLGRVRNGTGPGRRGRRHRLRPPRRPRADRGRLRQR